MSFRLAESSGNVSLRGVNPEGSLLNRPMSGPTDKMAPVKESEDNRSTTPPNVPESSGVTRERSGVGGDSTWAMKTSKVPFKPPLPEPKYELENEDDDDTDDTHSK